MDYNGYKILMTEIAVMGWPIDAEGNRDLQATPKALESHSFNGFPEFNYSVVDSDGWVLASFEELDEAKAHIDDEL